jgi:hypothetical protein
VHVVGKFPTCGCGVTTVGSVHFGRSRRIVDLKQCEGREVHTRMMWSAFGRNWWRKCWSCGIQVRFWGSRVHLVVDGGEQIGVEIFCEQAVWVLFGQILYGVVCFRYFEPGAKPVGAKGVLSWCLEAFCDGESWVELELGTSQLLGVTLFNFRVKFVEVEFKVIVLFDCCEACGGLNGSKYENCFSADAKTERFPGGLVVLLYEESVGLSSFWAMWADVWKLCDVELMKLELGTSRLLCVTLFSFRSVSF